MRNDICYARLALAVLRQARRDLRDPRHHRSAALFLRSPAAKWWRQAYRELGAERNWLLTKKKNRSIL